MNTFFFGYLPLKWKRLARVLSFVLIPLLVLINDIVGSDDDVFFVVGIWLVTVPIISYTFKPFHVKD
tara:strand:- start:58 stop:258 length:201 start_codon:yes stop_codon:yes gene_type:complete